jgi:hypothetical protein
MGFLNFAYELGTFDFLYIVLRKHKACELLVYFFTSAIQRVAKDLVEIGSCIPPLAFIVNYRLFMLPFTWLFLDFIV